MPTPPPIPDDRTPIQRTMDAVQAKKPIRPYCLKPEMCAGQGRQHCFTCQKAHADANGEAA